MRERLPPAGAPYPDGVLTTAELLERMVQGVFDEPDPDRRTAVIEEIFTVEVIFTDPHATVVGREALGAAVTALRERVGAARFTPAGPVREVGDLGMRPWRLGVEGQEPVGSGLDVVLVLDGRIARLWTFLD
jgi:hypothetical protein